MNPSLVIKRASTRVPLNTVIGDDDLCAWEQVRGITWVQTRNPAQARRLAKRSDGRLVAVGVAGGYLRTFEFGRSLAWARRLIIRYVRNETTANAALVHAVCPETNRSGRMATPYPEMSLTVPAMKNEACRRLDRGHCLRRREAAGATR